MHMFRELKMKEKDLNCGDIVKVKKEWLDPGEDGSMTYVVLEEAGPNRILVQALGTGLALAPTYVFDLDWVVIHREDAIND